MTLDYGRESILSFGSKNSSSKTLVSGKRKLVPLHDNARPHIAVSIKQFLAKQTIPELNHPHILLIYPHQTFSYSSKSNPR
jgi:hypothetical protein